MDICTGSDAQAPEAGKCADTDAQAPVGGDDANPTLGEETRPCEAETGAGSDAQSADRDASQILKQGQSGADSAEVGSISVDCNKTGAAEENSVEVGSSDAHADQLEVKPVETADAARVDSEAPDRATVADDVPAQSPAEESAKEAREADAESLVVGNSCDVDVSHTEALGKDDVAGVKIASPAHVVSASPGTGVSVQGEADESSAEVLKIDSDQAPADVMSSSEKKCAESVENTDPLASTDPQVSAPEMPATEPTMQRFGDPPEETAPAVPRESKPEPGPWDDWLPHSSPAPSAEHITADAEAPSKSFLPEDGVIWFDAKDARCLLATSAPNGKAAAPAWQRAQAAAAAHVEMPEEGSVDPRSRIMVAIELDSPQRARRAAKYMRLACEAQQGWVGPLEVDDLGDLTAMDVPESAYPVVYGNRGTTLVNISEETKTMIFFVDNSRTASGGMSGQQKPPPAFAWATPGRRIEVRLVGDVRTTRWFPGHVVEIAAGACKVRTENGLVHTVGFNDFRPRYAPGDEVDWRNASGDWTPACLEGQLEDGRLLVKPAEGSPIEAQPADVRPRVAETEDREEPEASVDPPAYQLAIFGDLPNRCAAMLRVMRQVDMKLPGIYSGNGPPGGWGWPSDVDWGCETLEIEQEILAKFIGVKGAMRRKFARAAECTIEYIGNIAYIVGPKENRRFAISLLETFGTSEKGNVQDVHEGASLHVERKVLPAPMISIVLGSARHVMNKIEDEEGVITFIQVEQSEQGDGVDEPPQAVQPEVEVVGKSEGEALDAVGDDSTAAVHADNKEDIPMPVMSSLNDPNGESETTGGEAAGPKDDAPLGASEADVAEPTPGNPEAKSNPTKSVLIVALSPRSRWLAGLRVMSIVESHSPGHFSSDLQSSVADVSELAVDIEDVGALPARWVQGERAMLQAASNCGFVCVGQFVHIVGSGEQRARGREYLKWFLEQMDRHLSLPATTLTGRSDMTVVSLLQGDKELLRDDFLRGVEQDTGTFLLFREVPDIELLAPGARVWLPCGDKRLLVEVANAEEDSASGGLQALRLLVVGGSGTAPTEETEAEPKPDLTSSWQLLIIGSEEGVCGTSR